MFDGIVEAYKNIEQDYRARATGTKQVLRCYILRISSSK